MKNHVIREDGVKIEALDKEQTEALVSSQETGSDLISSIKEVNGRKSMGLWLGSENEFANAEKNGNEMYMIRNESYYQSLLNRIEAMDDELTSLETEFMSSVESIRNSIISLRDSKGGSCDVGFETWVRGEGYGSNGRDAYVLLNPISCVSDKTSQTLQSTSYGYIQDNMPLSLKIWLSRDLAYRKFKVHYEVYLDYEESLGRYGNKSGVIESEEFVNTDYFGAVPIHCTKDLSDLVGKDLLYKTISLGRSYNNGLPNKFRSGFWYTKIWLEGQF